MATIPTQTRFPTSAQVPDRSIMDLFNKQVYLGNQFISTIGTVSLSDTSETNLMTIVNAATNGVSLFQTLRSFNVADNSGQAIVFRIYLKPTVITGGSTITPTNCRPANANTSVATMLKSPGTTTKGTLISVVVAGVTIQNNDNTLIVLDPGQSILITGQATAACIGTVTTVHYEI